MKPSSSISLCLALLLFFLPLCMGQNSVNCDQLRFKVEQMEKTDLNVVSPSLQMVFKESLLKLYGQYSRCLQRDIAAADSMLITVANTEGAHTIENKLSTLKQQKSDADNKIALLRTALNLPDVPPTSDSVPLDELASNGGGRPRSLGAPVSIPSPNLTVNRIASQPSLVCQPPGTYVDAPELLTDIAGKAALDVVQNNDHLALSAGLSQMLLYTVMDASSPASSRTIRGLDPYQYLSETARTDKQLGASAKSDGAVSAIEKPGFARLLGFAIEHGGINKVNDGTNLTLSTSLYSLYTLNNKDTAETYARAGILNRVGMAATFAVDNKDNELANARRNNLSEWSVKARLFGDRSTRSAGFQKFWDTEIRPLISDRLKALGGALEGLSDEIQISSTENFDQFESNLTDCLQNGVKKRMDESDYKIATPEKRKELLTALMIGLLKSNVLDRVQSGQLKLTDKAVKDIELVYLPNLKTALANLKKAGGELEKKLDDLKKAPLGTFAYTNHRQPTASDYSETKFLFEQDKSFFRPLKLTGNFGLSFYHKPNRTMNQQKLRDISAALSFDGSTRSPFTEADNLSKITFSFVGRYERLMENRRMMNRKPDIATAQFLVEIPFIRGFSLPFSLTYANATEEERKKNVRFNFGMRLDTDKLFDLLRASTNR